MKRRGGLLADFSGRGDLLAMTIGVNGGVAKPENLCFSLLIPLKSKNCVKKSTVAFTAKSHGWL